MSLISELVSSLNLKDKIKGSFTSLVASGTNITWSTLIKSLGATSEYLQNSAELATAVATPFFLLCNDMIEKVDDVNDVVLNNGNAEQLIEVSAESADSLMDLIENGPFTDHDLSFSDTYGQVYSLYGSNEYTIEDQGHTYLVKVRNSGSIPTSMADVVLCTDVDTGKVYASPTLKAISGSRRNVCDVVRDLSASSDVNEVLLDSANYFRTVSDAGSRDVASYVSYIANKWGRSSATISQIVNMISDAFVRGGIYGAIKTILQIVGSLKDLNATQDGRLEFVDPIIYMPRAWISGAIAKAVSTVTGLISAVISAVQPAIGIAFGMLGSVVTSLIQAPMYAAENETRMALDTTNLNKLPCFPLSLCNFSIDYEGYEASTALADLIKSTGCVQMVEVVGGILLIGLNEDQSKLSVSFHPGMDDAAYAAHLLSGAPKATYDGQGYRIMQSYYNYSTYCGFECVLHTNSRINVTGYPVVSQTYVDNGLSISKSMLETIWAKAKETSIPYESFSVSGVSDMTTDVIYRINCIFNAAIFILYCISLSAASNTVVIEPTTGHSTIFTGLGQSASLEWSSLNPLSSLGTGGLSFTSLCGNIFEDCICAMQFFQEEYEYYGETNPVSISANLEYQGYGLWYMIQQEVTWEHIVKAFSMSYTTENTDFIMTPVTRDNYEGNVTWFVNTYSQVATNQPIRGNVVNIVRNNWWANSPVSAPTISYSVSLPKYTLKSIVSFVLVSMTVTLAAGVIAAITVPKVIKWRRDMQRKSQVEIERAWNNCTGTEEGQGPTSENLKAYNDAVRKANFGRLLWGGTKFSRTNYWNSGDPADEVDQGSDEDSSLTSRLTELAQSLQQENTAEYPQLTEDVSTAKIIALINKNALSS